MHFVTLTYGLPFFDIIIEGTQHDNWFISNQLLLLSLLPANVKYTGYNKINGILSNIRRSAIRQTRLCMSAVCWCECIRVHTNTRIYSHLL